MNTRPPTLLAVIMLYVVSLLVKFRARFAFLWRHGVIKRTTAFRWEVSVACLSLLLALMSFAAPARAMNDLQTIEQGCLWGVYASSFTSVTAQTVDVMGYGNVGFSSITGNAFAFDYSIYAKGADATYTVVQTTATPNKAIASGAFNNSAPWSLPVPSAAVLSTSTVVTVPASVVWPTRVGAFMENPVFYFTSLSNQATYYVQVTYCKQRKP